MPDNTQEKDNDDLLKLYNEKILPVGISTPDKADEIVDIVTDYPWTVHQFSQRVVDADKASYTHNIPFCYAIERMQTVNSTVANIVSSLLGSSKALLAAGKGGLMNMMGRGTSLRAATNEVSGTSGQQGQTQGGTQGATITVPTVDSNGNLVGGGVTPPKEDNTNTEKKETPASKSNDSEAQSLAGFLSNKGSILDHISSLGDDLVNAITPRLAESNMANSEFLYPWRWHYFTKVTGKKFVFPSFTANQLLKLTNTWGDEKSKATDFFKIVLDRSEGWSEMAYAFKNFTDFLPKEGEAMTYEGFNLEKALGYNYNSSAGDEFDCQFVLYNTTKKDAWKKNYRFIVMFILRNLPLRVTMYSIKPPLLYDLIIPGVKHLPLCYVSKINIDSQGHVRNMTADNFLKEIVSNTQNTKTLVPVPEAWKVQIIFKSLIPSTMNLILNTTNFPINVTTTTR